MCILPGGTFESRHLYTRVLPPAYPGVGMPTASKHRQFQLWCRLLWVSVGFGVDCVFTDFIDAGCRRQREGLCAGRGGLHYGAPVDWVGRRVGRSEELVCACELLGCEPCLGIAVKGQRARVLRLENFVLLCVDPLAFLLGVPTPQHKNHPGLLGVKNPDDGVCELLPALQTTTTTTSNCTHRYVMT